MTQHINLYNPLFVKKKKPFSALTMAQALGFIAVGLGCMYFYATLQAHSAERLPPSPRPIAGRVSHQPGGAGDGRGPLDNPARPHNKERA